MSDAVWNNLTLNDEQTMLLETVRKFVADVVTPRAHAVDHEARYPVDTLREMSDLGLLSLLVPEKLSGAGMGAVAQALALEELGRGCGSTALALLAHSSLATRFLLEAGDAGQQGRWVPALATGGKLGALAFEQPEEAGAAGFTKSGDGYVLDGSRSFVTGATHADVIVWVAPGDAASAFVVEKGSPGLSVVDCGDRVGKRGAGTGDVRLEACRVPAASRIGPEGGLGKALGRVFDGAQVGLASLAVGMAERAFELARRYAKERIAFGKPLAAQQAVGLKLAEMRARIDCARHLAWHAARLDAQGADFSREALTARVAATETATMCGDEAIQIHGGYGFTREYVVERIYRDAKVAELVHLGNEQCRVDLSRRALA